MEKENKKRRVKVLIISIIIVLILALALSYAYFRTELNGSEQIVKVGELELVLDETSEGISLSNAVGISDEEGLSLTPSTFKLINNGNKAVDYIIYLDDNEISENDTRIDDKYLKYNLNKNGENSGARLLTTIGSNPNRILDSGTIEGKGTNEYSLGLWITDEVDGNYSGQVFSGKLRVEVSQARPTVSETLLANLDESNINTSDSEQTFIVGEDPNNYIWYSGKLWRAVLVNNEARTVKLVTQWNISAIHYDDDSSAFAGSYMESWLNDESVDGFLGNLREPEKFIVMDAKWNATMTTSISKPPETTIVEDPVGLLNIYEYTMSNRGTIYSNGYLNTGLWWWTLTPSSSTAIRCINNDRIYNYSASSYSHGARPSINLKADVKIVDGSGTSDDPYRLLGDNDTNLSGTRLNTRYSGEYIRFGNDENNLYRIVSHENGSGTKIVSAEPLKSSGTFIESAFGDTVNFSSSTTIGTFLNGDYLTNYVDSNYANMIEDSTTWYLGTVGYGTSYKLAKYTDTSMSSTTTSTTTKVGLLRMGELMAGQFEKYYANGSITGLTTNYWTLTPFSSPNVRYVRNFGSTYNTSPSSTTYAIRPSMNLKSNIIITSGDGTKENPFEIELRA